MGLSDQTPSIAGATDETLIGNVSDSLKVSVNDSSGTGITSTNNSGKQSLDVNVTSSISVSNPVDTYVTGSLAALNQTLTSTVVGQNSAIAKISGTWTGVIDFQVSIDQGTTYYSVKGIYLAGVFSLLSGTTSSGEYLIPTGGVTNVRLKMISYTSGTATVSLNISSGIQPSYVRLLDSSGNQVAIGQTTMAASMPVTLASNQSALPVTDNGGSLTVDGSVSITGTPNVTVTNAAGASAVNIQDGGNSITVDGTVTANAGTGNFNNASVGTNNAAIPTSSTLIGGNDGTNIVPINGVASTPSLTSVGLVTRNLPYEPQTYSAAAASFVAANTATDIFTITGSASKTIRVQRIVISATRTTATVADVLLIKRSTANSGGTSTTRTAVPHDSSNAAATATVLSYTANPTVGTAVGTLKCYKFMVGTVTPGNAQSQPGMTNVCWEFDSSEGQPIYLRGTSQVLAVNLNSVTWAGNSFCIDVEWVEI